MFRWHKFSIPFKLTPLIIPMFNSIKCAILDTAMNHLPHPRESFTCPWPGSRNSQFGEFDNKTQPWLLFWNCRRQRLFATPNRVKTGAEGALVSPPAIFPRTLQLIARAKLLHNANKVFSHNSIAPDLRPALFTSRVLLLIFFSRT